ncbi:AI-2E family transporter [Candidimonas sp. SYP-B2681]|uniref:AI-2E family transporter n=1 Tax=Candidimonas sp. SYP-B2681 TaxID=2497686 RepID=UPI000F88D2B9|nr:AI-2E family transporter [Candidimonas sp. SYP-B2681]RTZ47478.1 AI-2E family transporter [Candidimonas sp. SYP-B2681]
MNNSNLYFRTFIVLLVLVTLAFFWVLLPYYGAIFWGAILAIIFTPLHRRLLGRMRGRPNLAALSTLLIIILIVIIPMILITGALVQEGSVIYKRMSSGELNLGDYFEQIVSVLPPSVHDVLNRFGVGDIFSLREKLSAGALEGSKFLATQAVNVGQNTFEFLIGMGVMLYILFFFLRDGAHLARQSKQLIPLSEEHKQHLYRKFATVIRATVKGNIVVAFTQGALGGFMFWFLGIEGALLWGVLMAFLSLLPAVGAALIWVPVAIYFLVTGATWEGVTLTVFGVLVIGLVDNVLRPLLVGKDTKIPDYVILISTLGGLAVFGLNGFVIGPLVAALFIACWDLFPSAIRMNQEE